MIKLNFFEKIIFYLPHSIILVFYKLFKKSNYARTQKERKMNVHSREKYSLKGFDDNKCIFIHIPKAGGVSIAVNLFGNLGYGHKPIYKYLYIFDNKEFTEYFKFTFVRNPWDRLVSAYFFLKSGGFNNEDDQWFKDNLYTFDGFEDFVINWINKKNIYSWIHFIPQHEFITLNNKILTNKIYKIEEIEQSIDDINEKLNTKISITHENKSHNRQKDYKRYYNKRTMKIVSELYKKDIEMFNYQF